MKHLIIIFFVAGFVFSTLTSLSVGNNGEKVNLKGTLFTHPNNYEGSPYLFSDWKLCNINLDNGQKAYDIKVKFNILNGDLVFYHDTLKNLFVADPISIKSFTIYNTPNDSLYFEKYEGDGLSYRLKNGEFVEFLYNGNLKFMLKHTASISVANELNAKDKIFPRKRYFIKNNEQIIEIKPSIKSVIKNYTAHKKELRKYVNEHHLKNKLVHDIASLIEHIDNTIAAEASK